MKKWEPVNDNRIIDIMSKCIETFEENNYTVARQYAKEVLDINSNNPFALVFYELSNAWLQSLDDSSFAKVSDNVFEAVKLLIDACDGDESSCQLCDMALRHLGNLALAHIDEFSSKRTNDYDQVYNSKISSVVDTLNRTYYECILLIKDPTNVKSDMYEYVKSIAEPSMNMTNSDIPAKVIEACNNRLYIRDKGTKAPELSTYWESHAEERDAMADEASAVLKKLDELSAEIESITNSQTAEIQKVNIAINELRTQRSKLGLFKKKEKEIIDMKIKDKQTEIVRIKEKYARKLSAITEEKREYDEKAEYYVNAMFNGK